MRTNTFLVLVISLFFTACQQQDKTTTKDPRDLDQEGLSGAGLAMDEWTTVRAFPNKTISTKQFNLAFQEKQLQSYLRDENAANWEALGPKNIGGRTLCLGFHPTDPNLIYAGSAGGGLWKSTTAGVGVEAWEQVPTGFPVIGVASIAIDPNDGEVLYIGTGEVYNVNAAEPGTVDRTTRGTYGIGILKSTDGGDSWEKSLDWSLEDFTGVQDVVINPQNSNTIYAATTEGVYRSNNAGASWSNIHTYDIAVDIEINPMDTNLIYVSYGNLNSEQEGVFRSENGGTSFSKLAGGLPATWGGKTLISISESSPNVLFASVADAFSGIGLYRSTNGGDSWTLRNSEDIARWQGWYAHDVAINPTNPGHIVQVGIDAWMSLTGGTNMNIQSDWSSWEFGQTPVGGPEGPAWYVHADIHAAYFHPFQENVVYYATDGGIFYSGDGGMSFEGRNGGYQTQQFYSNFANSQTDANLAIGGMQDNATAIYIGDDAWVRVIGGDGMTAAVDFQNDDILYGSFQRFGLLKSLNKGQDFFQIAPDGIQNEWRAFNAPFELVESNSEIMYGGGQRVWKSENGGFNWNATTNNPLDGLNMVFKIGISPFGDDILLVSTAPNTSALDNPEPGKVYLTTDGGITFIQMQGLPELTATDFAFHPTNFAIAYITFSGFGGEHVYRTEDLGINWEKVDDGLPNVPTNTIWVNPNIPEHLYVGNDLGVYFSPDEGATWEAYDTGLPEAIMVMHMSYSPSNNKLRIASHGYGVYESDLQQLETSTKEVENLTQIQNFPNPALDQTTIRYELLSSAEVTLTLHDNQGRLIQTIVNQQPLSGVQTHELNIGNLAAGAYYYRLEGITEEGNQSFSTSRTLIKQ